MASFQFLDSREEDELHKSRLLNVEEKPFKRVTKRLLAPGSLLVTPNKLLTPPPENASEEAESHDAALQKQLDDRRQFGEDVEFDFAAFDYSISRIQFLLNSNERERARYQADKQRILETAQAVRDSTAQLRLQLEESKKTLEQRKKFDKLAEKITNNQLLKPRDVQEGNLAKLEEECKGLERESHAYSVTWKERREQFGRIVEEGMQLRRLIRDEKEEVERREGMDGGEEDGEVGEGSRGGQTPKHSSQSGNATPRPDGFSQPESGLKPKPFQSGSLSMSESRSNSRAASPAGSERRRGIGETEDSAMGDAVADTPMAEAIDSQMEVETPQVIIEEPTEERAEEGAAEEGEAEDKMDTT
ncbi:Tho complex subunit 7-domain-containing protein [Rhexocercosporidium sp. MPI-PUGE-AT-0058]|nr:Tho complex subunit 7-domain-containing protein [Rhexocercosporidium sp. MPI-PUGE-AT-0058]